MCFIVASFSIDKIKSLIELNKDRGNYSNSISEYDPHKNEFVSVLKRLGAIDPSLITKSDDKNYLIIHCQAPTSQYAVSVDFTHPARLGDASNSPSLFHNGLLKSNMIKLLQIRYLNTSNWDTELLLAQTYIGNDLNDIDGSFSCIYYNGTKLFHFRNSIAPMYFDAEDMTFSSVKFDKSEETPENQFLEIDFENKRLQKYFEFKTINNPYFILDL